MIEARLGQELEEVFANRAHLYRLLLEELETELRAERAERLLARVIARRGREVGARLFEGPGSGRSLRRCRPVPDGEPGPGPPLTARPRTRRPG